MANQMMGVATASASSPRIFRRLRSSIHRPMQAIANTPPRELEPTIPSTPLIGNSANSAIFGLLNIGRKAMMA